MQPGESITTKNKPSSINCGLEDSLDIKILTNLNSHELITERTRSRSFDVSN